MSRLARDCRSRDWCRRCPIRDRCRSRRCYRLSLYRWSTHGKRSQGWPGCRFFCHLFSRSCYRLFCQSCCCLFCRSCCRFRSCFRFRRPAFIRQGGHLLPGLARGPDGLLLPASGPFRLLAVSGFRLLHWFHRSGLFRCLSPALGLCRSWPLYFPQQRLRLRLPCRPVLRLCLPCRPVLRLPVFFRLLLRLLFPLRRLRHLHKDHVAVFQRSLKGCMGPVEGDIQTLCGPLNVSQAG